VVVYTHGVCAAAVRFCPPRLSKILTNKSGFLYYYVMRKIAAVVLTSLILLLSVQTSFAEYSAEEQARIMEEKRQLIEQMKGKSKEEQARMIEEFRARIFGQQATSNTINIDKKEELQTKVEGFRDQRKAQILDRRQPARPKPVRRARVGCTAPNPTRRHS